MQLHVPTKEQVEWADCEIGAIIHVDINVYEPEYQWRGQWDYDHEWYTSDYAYRVKIE